jgi:uncharacterized protein YndB with AHSA1/START domain
MANKEVTLTRVLNAPRDLVFDTWINPEHMKQWWGPNGFTSLVCEVQARKGGTLYIEMRAPDGSLHQVHGYYDEVVKPERIVFIHDVRDEANKSLFEIWHTITFEEHNGNTKLTVVAKALNVTPEMLPFMEGMEEGWAECIDKLENYTETAERELVVSRILNAPRELVFDAWTNPEHIKHWWGPNGFTNTIHKMDAVPGGEWDLVMHGPEGTDYKNQSTFIEVVKPERIVISHDSGPKYIMTVTFIPYHDKTFLSITMQFETIEQKDRSVKTVGADKGLIENMDRLEGYITRL